MSARNGHTVGSKTKLEEAVPPARAIGAEPAHLPTLDGIRGLAVIMVLMELSCSLCYLDF